MRMVRLAENTAREICLRCPVIALCLKVGLYEDYGIWGGTTPEQRRKLKRQQQI
jgi:WhiB family redox-sensing transcriptional regulator